MDWDMDWDAGPDEDSCGGDGGDDGGGCFLTTAIVERRGVEADDGPTLTALRAFRDGYMMQTAKDIRTGTGSAPASTAPSRR